MRRLAAAATAALLGLSACDAPGDATPTPAPASCDAGEEAFVTRAFLLMWGRRPHGAAETRMWAEVARTHGRDAVIQALSHDQQWVDRWTDFTLDALGVARTGDRSYSACFGTPMFFEPDPELAAFIRQNGAAGDSYPAVFNMADVIESSLLVDDLSVPWRVNLFARMNRPLNGANVSEREMENNRRTAFGDEVFDLYLHRNLTCLPCHNSEYSVTGSDDPAQDRTWEVPGLFEKALLGSSYGRDRESAYAVFRYQDLMRGDAVSVNPWGMSPACGTFAPAAALTDDLLDHEGYFIEAFGETGSVWQVEAALAEGVRRLEEGGLDLVQVQEPEGPEAFAWLTAASLTERVWKEATGASLTIATGFPRNQAQRDTLQGLTALFVEEGWSLRALLVAIATQPSFNLAAPARCSAAPYAMDPLFNPWTIADEDPSRRGNGPGDVVQRQSARTLVRQVHDALGWAQPDRFLARGDPMSPLQTSLGAYMRTSQPGFNGTDFQGVLAFEASYGACARPEVGGAGDGCQATPGHGGCASCDCQACVCGLEPYCCDVQWDEICVALCQDSCGGCGGGLAARDEDSLDRILAEGTAQQTDVEALVLALKDRVTGQGELDDEERTLVEALLGCPLDAPAGDHPEIAAPLRVLCGALLLSPQVFLAVEPPAPGPIPQLALDVAADCDRLATLTARVGVTATCGAEFTR